MQLARRGGMSGLPIILPEKVDGYVQAIRDKNISPDAQVGDPSFSFVNAGLGVECQAVQVDPSHEATELDMEVGWIMPAFPLMNHSPIRKHPS